MREHGTNDMVEVDAWLSAARNADAPVMSNDLMARILADAAAEHEGATLAKTAPPRWRDWIDALGGWPAMGGLVAAGVAGLWIGVSPTGAVNDMMAQVLGETVSVSLVTDDGVFDWGIEG